MTEAITTLQYTENRFGLVRVEDENLFSQWYEGLPEITEAEKSLCGCRAAQVSLSPCRR
ncbi:hypothetical protein ANSO36C_11850 [Nostoc cf. commune SO-36]|uniref:Uncharacterized protein n=1 Tax=Nostoc cf. commune SO-36 TaxID=449208 RepID=A0ABM7YXI6_NOSCO|nr:hypothetical protein ANSO36C_11850 [Nostoc cf. commune SO-36]